MSAVVESNRDPPTSQRRRATAGEYGGKGLTMKRTKREVVEALVEFLTEYEEPEPKTPEEVDAYLRAHGYDPVELVKSMSARIKQISDAAQKRLDETGHL